MTSIRLPGGFRINIGKKGIGASISKKGFGLGVGPNGTRIRTTIPGTGISVSETINSKKFDKIKDIILKKKPIKKQVDILCIVCGCVIDLSQNNREDKTAYETHEMCSKCLSDITQQE